jgi:hypothetical protein
MVVLKEIVEEDLTWKEAAKEVNEKEEREKNENEKDTNGR